MISLQSSHLLCAKANSGAQKALSQASVELELSGLTSESKYMSELGQNVILFEVQQRKLAMILKDPSQRAQLLSLTKTYSTQWCSQSEKAYCQLAVTVLAVKEMESLAI